MMVRALDAATAARLAALPVTAADDSGQWRRFSHSRVLRRRDLAGCIADLSGWQVQARSGLAVAASELTLRPGTDVLLRLGRGPVCVRAACRVIAVMEESDRWGFTYATLAGHPEEGVESFLVERLVDGSLLFTVSARSRPSSALARLGGPVTHLVQGAITRRYLRALDR